MMLFLAIVCVLVAASRGDIEFSRPTERIFRNVDKTAITDSHRHHTSPIVAAITDLLSNLMQFPQNSDFASSLRKHGNYPKDGKLPHDIASGYVTVKLYDSKKTKCSQPFYYQEIIRIGSCFPFTSSAGTTRYTIFSYSGKTETITMSTYDNVACSGSPISQEMDTVGCNMKQGYKLQVDPDFGFGATSGYGSILYESSTECLARQGTINGGYLFVTSSTGCVKLTSDGARPSSMRISCANKNIKSTHFPKSGVCDGASFESETIATTEYCDASYHHKYLNGYARATCYQIDKEDVAPAQSPRPSFRPSAIVDPGIKYLKIPTRSPTCNPTLPPSYKSTTRPSPSPTLKPSPKSSQNPTLKPSPRNPTLKPSSKSSPKPTVKPTKPSTVSSFQPSTGVLSKPSFQPNSPPTSYGGYSYYGDDGNYYGDDMNTKNPAYTPKPNSSPNAKPPSTDDSYGDDPATTDDDATNNDTSGDDKPIANDDTKPHTDDMYPRDDDAFQDDAVGDDGDVFDDGPAADDDGGGDDGGGDDAGGDDGSHGGGDDSPAGGDDSPSGGDDGGGDGGGYGGGYAPRPLKKRVGHGGKDYEKKKLANHKNYDKKKLANHKKHSANKVL